MKDAAYYCELYNERAAIMEYDGKLTRRDAERLADISTRLQRLADKEDENG